MKLELVRFAYLPTCTLGWLTAGALRLATIEDRWNPDPDGPGGQRLEGTRHESCVPDGLYELVPHSSSKHPNVWRLVNPTLGVYSWPGDIPPGQLFGRSAILIHAGNTEDDLLGCLAVGRAHLVQDNRHRLVDSQMALNVLREVLGTGLHQLQIRPVAGTSEALK